MKKTVILLFVLSCAITALSQDTISVPVESIKNFWVDSPTNDSSYEWGIEKDGGTIVSGQGTDNIYMEFDGTEGISTVWVQETNEYGCTGEKAYIIVERFIGPDASLTVTGDTLLCYDNSGSELTITFTGNPPFTLNYKVNDSDEQITTDQLQYIITVESTTETIVYELISVTDGSGVQTILAESATIEVMEPMNILKIMHD